jgi:hypothetical protein
MVQKMQIRHTNVAKKKEHPNATMMESLARLALL